MELVPTEIEGCFEIRPDVHLDERGTFVKTFHKPTFGAMGLESDFCEEYYSTSRQRVLRGLHFQVPPHAHAKLVYCVEGAVLDAVVDLRQNSPSFGRHIVRELDAGQPKVLYIGRGLAHGFYVRSERATLLYKVTSVHVPEADKGIRWDSVCIAWPDATPIVSERDRRFPALRDFTSPY